MIHYEIALAIIGITVTIMGIIIAFHIGFVNMQFTEQHEIGSKILGDFRRERITTRSDISDEELKPLIGILKASIEALLTQKRLLPKSAIKFIVGLIIILVLIIQTFWWEIDQKTLQISQQNFYSFCVLLAIGLIWTGYYIFDVYRFAYRSVTFLLQEYIKILDRLERK